MIARAASEGGGEFDLALPPLPLEAGERIDPHVVRGWSWGAEDAPTVLVVHSLTGEARVDRWWGPVLGLEKPLDPRRFRLLCFNLLGSCHGTTGPGRPGFPVGEVQLTTWDQARSILLALDAMGVERVHLCVGGSLGGMVALCLAALDPARFERVAPIAAAARSSAWVVGWNHVAREILRLDPGYPSNPERGLSLARQLAMLTYRAEPGLDARQPRPPHPPWASSPPYPIHGYLEHQGRKLLARFDARSYLALLGAMDHHDLGRRPALQRELARDPRSLAGDEASRAPSGPEEDEGWAAWGLDRIRASVLVASIDSDQLFPPQQSLRLAAALRRRGALVEEATIRSPHGHDAFLIEWEQLGQVLERALRMPGAAARQG